MNNSTAHKNALISLPEPRYDSDTSIEETLQSRRSVRDFNDREVNLTDLSQLLWACQGITSASGYRTTPSAGALYPLEIYILVERVNSLEPGLYHYKPSKPGDLGYLRLVKPGKLASSLAKFALGQEFIMEAAASIIITSVRSRTAVKYGDRAERYIFIEVGHAAQNVWLQAQALGLGVVSVGAFYDEKVKLFLEGDVDPQYILCVGHQK